MDGAVVAHRGNRDPGGAQVGGVRLSLVPQYVSFAVDDQGWGQPGQVAGGGAERRCVISARWPGSVVYWSQNHCMASRRSQ